ncbi:B12-binding domain/radical SAM domain-containing protein [Pseudomonas sp. S36]|uniref:B12-binding domain/radical SAM domain-containing protein n=1 Tax=Pseudomonas sp. S36 TaxID=2767447 RepID=UPI001913BFE6|nr:B12-binding domain/radical SAM domain-containing protein [Pseudomonas sp. S36]MBK4991663.1 B12-binding domain/radical SAM domain-containing protein [Pseudomonas sp. S36]
MPLSTSPTSSTNNPVSRCSGRAYSRQIRAVAVSAPESPKGAKSTRALNSCEPVSLFNACRHAAYMAQIGASAWAYSSWAMGRKEARDCFMLMYSLDDVPAFEALLLAQKPNLVLIGAMTLCMPGAVHCAQRVRELLGTSALIVLGGRHVNETLYLDNEKTRNSMTVRHHKASPGRLIREHKIPPLFDIIISGEGELVITAIGEALARSKEVNVKNIAELLETDIPGLWIADFPGIDTTLASCGVRLDQNQLPSAIKAFGVQSSFNVFKGRLTSHVFSYTGRGCFYDCAFCSERRSVAGSITDAHGANSRVYEQFQETVLISQSDPHRRKASAFVEDSIFLNGSPAQINALCERLELNPLDLVFGGQFTIDLIIQRRHLIERLASNGLSYVFLGLETLEPQEIGGISKDIGRAHSSWQQRFLEALDVLIDQHISCGCALLFGLGETQVSREHLLKLLIALKKRTGQPVTLSANWAVQHPLKSCPESQKLDYLQWGTPAGELLDLFHRFGEASLFYPIDGVAPPQLDEVVAIIEQLDEFEVLNEH